MDQFDFSDNRRSAGIARIPASHLRSALIDDQEITLLDPREEGAFSKNHLLLAVNLPLSRLELGIERLVPRKSTRMVLTDGGDMLSERAALRLKELGYQNVAVLDGGVQAWQDAGYRLFSGVNVPSKAFGEHVEHCFRTPSITPEDLQEKFSAREDLIVLDSRPANEYSRMNIPGSTNVPGAELVYRFAALPIKSETLVVVNCAGRTRSIIGAQSLINAGVKNPVVALRGGTMAWELAGFRCEHGASREAPEPSAEGKRWARDAAAKVAERFGVRKIDSGKLEEYVAERDHRTLYLIDVRTLEEYIAGHCLDSIFAPGGQLVQAVDKYIGTRNARIVLFDDQLVRAQMTASWLIQLGWGDVYVFADPLADKNSETGSALPRIPALDVQIPLTQPLPLQESLNDGTVTVIDFGSSLTYRKGHIPGAWFAVRARLPECLKRITLSSHLVATGEDPDLTRVAAADLKKISGKTVSILEGGNRGWSDAGFPLKKGLEHLATETDDVWLKPYDRETGVREAMEEYLNWEVALLEQVREDGTMKFICPKEK